jgi:GNAT superfamily N-acetyltransferase
MCKKKNRNNCECFRRFEVRLCSDYAAFKKVLDRGRHPAFIGRDNFANASANGGALIYHFEGEPVAVSLINPHYGVLLALNVDPAHRSHGLGRAIMNFLVPNFARVIENKVKWFESLGFVKLGKPKKGISLKTQIMVRARLLKLAGRLKNLRKRMANS